MADDHLHALPKGHRIEEYEIVRVLGAGGFGITYLAFDHKLDGPVALKEYFPAGAAVRSDGDTVVPSSSDQAEVFAWGLERFIEEARAIHRFRHPNVVRAHRYIEANGTAYIVMEHVEGESLAAVMEQHGRLTPEQWRPWFDALLDGLAHVHARGYLHRDIKPGNIVIRAADGQPMLIDFGAARVAAAARTHTQILSPAYAPIEQHSINAKQGPFTDIYSLAAVSYRVLTGEPPPSAPDRVLDDRYAPVTDQMTEGGPTWLGSIDQALALRPEDRPCQVDAWRKTIADMEAASTGRTETQPMVSADRQRQSKKTNFSDTPGKDRVNCKNYAVPAFLILIFSILIAVLVRYSAEHRQMMNEVDQLVEAAVLRNDFELVVQRNDSPAWARLLTLADTENTFAQDAIMNEIWPVGAYAITVDDLTWVTSWVERNPDRMTPRLALEIATAWLDYEPATHIQNGYGSHRTELPVQRWILIAIALGAEEIPSHLMQTETLLSHDEMDDAKRDALKCVQTNYVSRCPRPAHR